ncbi:MAG: hypothetical protein PHT07_15285 [Paludibacter sp.]|nr:hypothetical protein [Paludibacter sp.]
MVLGFWHILLINDYLSIISEQLQLIIKSGLYCKVERIYVGCLGSQEERLNLQKFFHDYDKIQIISHSTVIENYEFHTLKILRNVCLSQPDFYGFYIHTKGVSYPGNEGGKYWRDYMNYYIITDWKEAVRNLDTGYQTYGVKLLSHLDLPARKMHYSGNFYWFRSEYAKTLRPVESLNQNDRFEAEMYMCSNSPIAATGCQLFVDYNTKGTFNPPTS